MASRAGGPADRRIWEWFFSREPQEFPPVFSRFPEGITRRKYPSDEKGYTVCRELSWSYYRLLMRVENPAARGYYIGEAISQNWSVRALERQTDSLYFERLLASRDRDAVMTKSKGSDAAADRAPGPRTLWCAAPHDRRYRSGYSNKKT